MADLASPVPARVIAEILGVDRARTEEFRGWADTITAAMTGSKRNVDPVESGAAQASGDLARYMAGIIEARSRAPRDDLVSVLVRAREGDVLTPAEAVGFAVLLVFAGTETTTNLIGNAVRVLIEDRAVRDRVFADPDLAPRLVEETMRFDNPVQYVFRRARRPAEIAGVRIGENAIVCVLLGSANRDPERWGPTAEEFDLDRETSGHLGFGFGVHFCLGAALARLEADCALRSLIPLLARSDFDGHPFTHIDSVQFRGVSRLCFTRR